MKSDGIHVYYTSIMCADVVEFQSASYNYIIWNNSLPLHLDLRRQPISSPELILATTTVILLTTGQIRGNSGCALLCWSDFVILRNFSITIAVALLIILRRVWCNILRMQ